ncbi:MAG: putative RiPP precursor [Solirubrobacterales bacterium]|nr:putative RiPP precursor [Solirubrobacterales bacterium]
MTYETPSIVDLGALTQITAGMAAGQFTDRDIPQGSAITDLTFS